jgi:hypothetical protein
MHDLGGVVSGLSTDPATTALVELDGKVDDFGSARVRGSIQPFRACSSSTARKRFPRPSGRPSGATRPFSAVKFTRRATSWSDCPNRCTPR